MCAWFVGNMVHEGSCRTGKKSKRVVRLDEDEPDIEEMGFTPFMVCMCVSYTHTVYACRLVHTIHGKYVCRLVVVGQMKTSAITEEETSTALKGG